MRASIMSAAPTTTSQRSRMRMKRETTRPSCPVDVVAVQDHVHGERPAQPLHQPGRRLLALEGLHPGLGHEGVEALLALGQAAAGAWGDLVPPDAAEKAARIHRKRLRAVDMKFF